MGYKPGYQLRGLTRVEDEKLARFYDRYDDLYEILIRLKKGDRIQEVPEPEAQGSSARDEEPTARPGLIGPLANAVVASENGTSGWRDRLGTKE